MDSDLQYDFFFTQSNPLSFLIDKNNKNKIYPR